MTKTVTPRASKIVLLGTGTPNADPRRSGPSVAVIVHQRPYLVDFGPGVIRRAAAAHQKGVEGLAVEKLERAFVTHLHSDHTAGYPDLILTPWVLERERPLAVYGPPGIQAMTEHVLAAYREDIRERIEGLEPINETGWRVRAFEVQPGLVYQDENVQVEAFEVDHGSWPAYGYKFYTPDRTIVISGDTVPTERCLEMSQGCDVLIHEVYSSVGFENRSPEWQRYHGSVHTSARELVELATQAKPGLLILYHQLFHSVSEEVLLAEVQEHYEGKVVMGCDLDVY